MVTFQSFVLLILKCVKEMQNVFCPRDFPPNEKSLSLLELFMKALAAEERHATDPWWEHEWQESGLVDNRQMMAWFHDHAAMGVVVAVAAAAVETNKHFRWRRKNRRRTQTTETKRESGIFVEQCNKGATYMRP